MKYTVWLQILNWMNILGKVHANSKNFLHLLRVYEFVVKEMIVQNCRYMDVILVNASIDLIPSLLPFVLDLGK